MDAIPVRYSKPYLSNGIPFLPITVLIDPYLVYICVRVSVSEFIFPSFFQAAQMKAKNHQIECGGIKERRERVSLVFQNGHRAQAKHTYKIEIVPPVGTNIHATIECIQFF